MDSEKEALSQVNRDYFYNRTCKVIPDGVQTLSKMPSKHVEGVYPIFLEKGEGAYVWGDSNRYIDYPCGLGSVLLGYNYQEVNDAAIAQLAKGILFSLPNKLETELAEKICQIVPCAEMVRFLKTGSEATSAAVRIARAYTGKDLILCCGYHGWHDWYNVTTTKKKGVPDHDDCRQLKYNKPSAFKYANWKDVAAVIMEPYILEQPELGFLENIRRLCDAHGALLIFDEVITGFRTPTGSAQGWFKVTPDLTALGKAMGNGFPISCVCGKKEIMKELEGDCFVSSTFGGSLVSIAAALKVIDIVQTQGVIKHIWNMGNLLKSSFNRFADDLDNTECIGYPPRTFFNFPTEEHKSLFWQECLKKGILFGYAQFINFSHKEAQIYETIGVMEKAMAIVKNHWENPSKALEGKCAQQTFRLVTTKR